MILAESVFVTAVDRSTRRRLGTSAVLLGSAHAFISTIGASYSTMHLPLAMRMDHPILWEYALPPGRHCVTEKACCRGSNNGVLSRQVAHTFRHMRPRVRPSV